jgi:hypothetical protein
MVNTLAAMHNLKGKHIYLQAFPQEKLKEDIYLRFPAGFEHKNEEWALSLKKPIRTSTSINKLVSLIERNICKTGIQTIKIRPVPLPQEGNDPRIICG